MGKDVLRIGNAGGYWGDDPYALRRQVMGATPLDVISIDFLAEITMSILQKQRQKDPNLGYARDFITQVEPLLPTVVERGIRIITNAGGVNPRACAQALAEAGRRQGLSLRIAVVEGDDLVPALPQLRAQGARLDNLETGAAFETIAPRVLAANAYFGALPVAEALNLDPHVVLCGRVTDTGITLAPMIHAFGWSLTDWNRLAAGIVAGHLIECGAQSTGGNFTDWRKVPSFQDMGFPILEVHADGSFVLTKHPGSGGLVSCQTVREQLLYEMGDPASYLTPDVVADFRSIQLTQEGPDRVRVSGITGRPPTDLLKASIAYADGYKASGSLILSGPEARAKADVFASIFWDRVREECERAALPVPEACLTERVGHDATHRNLTPAGEPLEVLLRLSARSQDRRSLEVFRKLLPSLILSGPPGVAVTGGAPAISEVVSYWPALFPRALTLPRITLLEGDTFTPTRVVPWPETPGPDQPEPWEGDTDVTLALGRPVTVPLMQVAHARSGDKGDTVNIGLIARSEACYQWLRDHVTAEQVRTWFSEACRGPVTRYEVPNLWALNFLLEASLGGGGSMSLFLDAQGKTFAQALLRCPIDIPANLLTTIRPEHAACPGEAQP